VSYASDFGMESKCFRLEAVPGRARLPSEAKLRDSRVIKNQILTRFRQDLKFRAAGPVYRCCPFFMHNIWGLTEPPEFLVFSCSFFIDNRLDFQDSMIHIITLSVGYVPRVFFDSTSSRCVLFPIEAA